MADGNASFGNQVREYKAKLARIVPGLSEDDVKSILGQPTSVLSRDEKETGSDVMRELGSSFRFGDDATETVWSYQDPLRPRFFFNIGFSKGVVCGCWKEAREAP